MAWPQYNRGISTPYKDGFLKKDRRIELLFQFMSVTLNHSI